MTTQAQREAWETIQPQLTRRQEDVLAVIKKGTDGATLREIADTLGVDMNVVSGRVTELQAARAVQDSGRTRVNPRSGKNITVWVPAAPAQIALI